MEAGVRRRNAGIDGRLQQDFLEIAPLEIAVQAGPDGVKVESSDGKKVELGGKSQ